MYTQKYVKYDLVHIVDELPETMSHFESGKEAIIMGSYKDLYGGSSEQSPEYSIYIKERGEHSWYPENTLIFEKHLDNEDLLNIWKNELSQHLAKISDLDWIFGDERKKLYPNDSMPSAVIIALADKMGISVDELWGSHGEGTMFYLNSCYVYEIAKPFLDTNNKDGFLEVAEIIKNKKGSNNVITK